MYRNYNSSIFFSDFDILAVAMTSFLCSLLCKYFIHRQKDHYACMCSHAVNGN